jgi:signal transduction histidine kinase
MDEVRLGVVGATPADLAQIREWAAGFRQVTICIEAAVEIAVTGCDLYLVVAGESTGAGELATIVAQGASTPWLMLAAHDEEGVVDVAMAAGAFDFLVWDSLDAGRLERAIRFALQRSRTLARLKERERYLAMACERDRLRLASMLHDGPMQDLIGARLLLGTLMPGDSTDEIQECLQSVVQAVRWLCSELKPPALGPFGLEKAIRAHMQILQVRSPEVEVTLALDVGGLQVPEWAQLALFRIFQAAVSNVYSHAQASHVWVRLLLNGEQIRLTVADDGQGFEVPDSWLGLARSGRYGLLTLQEQVDALGGRLVVQSTVGSGARLIVHAPLRQPATPLPGFLAPTAPDRAAPDGNR